MDAVKQIRSMLRTPCRSIKIIPFDVEDYSSVVRLWLQFKRGRLRRVSSREIFEPVISSFFSFHYLHDPHVLLYSSRLLDTVLLMAKVDGEYINIRASREGLSVGHPSFIAVYA